MGRPERLRDLVHSAIEAYELASHPPAQDYGRKVDPTAAMSRPSMLTMGIDIKYIVHNQLSALPQQQAENVIDYIQDPTSCFIHTLTEYYQINLKKNIVELKQSLTRQGYR